MRAAKLKLLGLLILLAIAGGQDHAQAKAMPDPPQGWGAAALELAEAYWGGPPTMCSTLSWSFDVELPPDRGGQAREPTRPDTPCTAEIAPAENLYGLCVVVVHEDGHLHGLGHSPDPTNVMFGISYSEGVPWTPEVWQCRAFAGELSSVTNVTHKPTRPR